MRMKKIQKKTIFNSTFVVDEKRQKQNENKNDNKNTKILKFFVVIHVNVDIIKSNYFFRFSWILNYNFDSHVVNKTMKQRFQKNRNCTNDFIEKIMNDYYFIVLNLVIFCNIHEMKTQKMCECQNTNFNKNALIFFSSNYINWILIATFAKHICENCISTFFYNNRLCFLFCILTNLIWFKIFVQTFSTMRVLKFFQRRDFFSDALFEIFEQIFSTWYVQNYASMWRLQKRTNRNSMI